MCELIMTFDKSKDASMQLINTISVGTKKGHTLGSRVSITHLYNFHRGRQNNIHPLDITAEPGRHLGTTVGFVTGLAGGIRNITTRQFINADQLNKIEKHIKEIQSALNTSDKKSATTLISNITTEYERTKTSASSNSSQHLANELKRKDSSIDNKLNHMIHYVNAKSNYFNQSYNKNNGKKLLNIITKELEAFKKRNRQAEIASVTGIDQALKRHDEQFKETGLNKLVRTFIKP